MTFFCRQQQRGIGLVELMIAVTLSLVLSGAVIQVFIASKNSYRMQDAVSGLQENGRFAISYLSQDIRMAGFIGCASIDKVSVNNIESGLTNGSTSQLDPTSVLFDSSSIIGGIDNVTAGDATFGTGSSALKAVPLTDVLIVRRAVSAGANLTSQLAAVTSNIQISATNPLASSIRAGDPVLISDCTNADLFRVTSIATGTITHNTSGTKNITPSLSKKYGTDAEVLTFQTTSYYVRDTGRLTPQGDHISALYVSVQGGGGGGVASLTSLGTNYTGELVEGVEDMQIQYGVDTNVDGDNVVNTADVYKPASTMTTANWKSVVSVRLYLVMQSESSDAVAKTGALAQTYKVGFSALNTSVTGTDGRLRQVYYSVIGIRNRLL